MKETVHRLLQACIRENILFLLEANSHFIIPLIQSDQFIFIKNLKKFSLSRFEFPDEIYLFTKNQNNPIFMDDPFYLLKLIKNELNNLVDLTHWEQFEEEIKNHQQNLDLSFHHFQQHQSAIQSRIKKTKFQYLYEWAKLNEIHPDLFFERWVVRGHPSHPCSKTKLGFSLEETIQYSNEFDPDVKLMLSAIHKNHMHIESMSSDFNYHDWFKKTFPSLHINFEKALKKLNKNANEYLPIPVHPWQAKHIISNKFKSFIDNQLLILFPTITFTAKPTSSFRTLTKIDDPFSPHIKLPVAIQSTSAVRTVSAASTENSPKISNILNDILQKENHFNGSLRSLSEFLGLHIITPSSNDQRFYSVIFRDNPNQHLEKNEMAIPVAALFEKSPLNDQPIFIEILSMNQINTIKKVKVFFENYASIVLQAYLDLYLLYGIGLEGHQQNTLVIFCNAKPVAMLNRDYGGVRIHLDSLQSQGYTFVPHPDSATVCKNREDARNKLLHTVYQSHLGEWCKALSLYFKCDEKIFWSIIRKITIERFEKLKNKMSIENWENDWQSILEMDWPLKALMRMRLCEQSHDYIFVACENPLLDNHN